MCLNRDGGCDEMRSIVMMIGRHTRPSGGNNDQGGFNRRVL